jgi:hypothetical protein
VGKYSTWEFIDLLLMELTVAQNDVEKMVRGEGAREKLKKVNPLLSNKFEFAVDEERELGGSLIHTQLQFFSLVPTFPSS